MPAWNANGVGCSFSRAGATTRNDTALLSEWCEDEDVRIFLAPLDSVFFAIDSQVKVVFITNRNLRGPESSFGALVETKHHVDVIVEPTAGNERAHICRNLLESQPGYETGEIECVRADVAERACRPPAWWIGSPLRLLLHGALKRS